MNSLSDEKEIFFEDKARNKDKTNISSEKKIVVKDTISNIQSSNSVFNQHENLPLNPAVENLLCMLLNIHAENLKNNFNKELISNSLLQKSSFEIPKLQRQISSPESFDESRTGFVIPSMRKSVSIIVNSFVLGY